MALTSVAACKQPSQCGPLNNPCKLGHCYTIWWSGSLHHQSISRPNVVNVKCIDNCLIFARIDIPGAVSIKKYMQGFFKIHLTKCYYVKINRIRIPVHPLANTWIWIGIELDHYFLIVAKRSAAILLVMYDKWDLVFQDKYSKSICHCSAENG